MFFLFFAAIDDGYVCVTKSLNLRIPSQKYNQTYETFDM